MKTKQIGGIDKYLNKIICDDCLNILKQLPDKSIDMILQDPPYNTTACEWEWDIMTKIDEFWKEWKRVIKDNGAIVMTASQPFTSKLVMSNLKMFRYEWIWEKSYSGGFINAKRMPMKYHENILVFYKKQPIYNPIKREYAITTKQRAGKSGLIKILKGKTKNEVHKIIHSENMLNIYKGAYPKTIIKISCDTYKREKGKMRFIPTQKPVALMEYFIKTYTNEGDIVFDGFAGSGTTAVACINTNRKYICVEILPKYCKIAQQRIDNLPKRLF